MADLKRLTLEELDPAVRQQISQQSYSLRPVIDGVQLIDLRQMVDDGGSFTELVRCDAEGNVLAVPGFKIRQSNFSELVAGAVKAWHLHLNQEDLWFVPSSERLLVGLYDLRTESPTYRNALRFTMGAGKAQLLFIPRGVAHGVANPWNSRSLMIYFVNQHFSAEQTDEHRLPWDLLGADFWTIQRG